MTDGYVPIRMAAEAYQRPIQTIHRWVREGIVQHQRRDGRVYVFFADVLEAATTRQRRLRCADVAA